MKTRTTNRMRSTQQPAQPAAPVWQGEEYPRIDGGRRVVRVHHIQGPEWVRAFRRWSLRLECHTVDEPGTVSAFLNLGNDPAGPRVGKGKQSKYYQAWTKANGGPPKTGQSMDWDIFIDKWFVVQIEDCTRNSEGATKDDAEVYSRITKFIELTGPQTP